MKKIALLILVGFTVYLNSCKEDSEKFLVYNDLYKMSSKSTSYHKNSGPYKLFSLKKNSYLISYPYEHVNVVQGDLCSGITQVYDTKSNTLKYEIDRYFGINNTFLSEDGANLVYINDYWKGSSYDSCSTDLILFYQNGQLHKGYTYKELIGIEPNNNDWLFKDYQYRFFAENNHYLVENDLYVMTDTTREVIVLDLNTAKIKRRTSMKNYFENLKKIDFPKDNLVDFIPIEEHEGLPKSKEGVSFKKGLASFLDAEVGESTKSKGKSYRFTVYATISQDGNYVESEIESHEKILIEEANNLRNQINKYLAQTKFENTSLYKLDNWQFEERIEIAKKPESLAIEELKKWERISCESDTLRGIYIPKDIYDAHSQLDGLLDDESKEALKNGENSHFGIGMWMRNNWGLWSYSRLACYFTERGIDHPDDMSGFILKTYRLRLSGNDSELKELLEELENF